MDCRQQGRQGWLGNGCARRGAVDRGAARKSAESTRRKNGGRAEADKRARRSSVRADGTTQSIPNAQHKPSDLMIGSVNCDKYRIWSALILSRCFVEERPWFVISTCFLRESSDLAFDAEHQDAKTLDFCLHRKDGLGSVQIKALYHNMTVAGTCGRSRHHGICRFLDSLAIIKGSIEKGHDREE